MELSLLIERIRQGFPDATAEIWNYFGDDLRRRARTRLRQYGIAGETESMDICNAVLLDMIRNNESRLERPEDVVFYLLRAIDNQVRDTFRQLTRQRRDFRRLDARPVESHEVSASDKSPSSVMMRREVLSQIAAQLDVNDRPMIQMLLDNCGWEEIGRKLGIEPDTARMRFNRATAKVKQTMRESL